MFGWTIFSCSQLLSAGGVPAAGCSAAGRMLFAAVTVAAVAGFGI